MVGGQPPVAQPAPLTPPEEEQLLPYLEAIRYAERLLRVTLDDGLRRTILGAADALTDLDREARAAAIRGAAETIAAAGWHGTPGLWRDRIRKAAVARAAPQKTSGVTAVRAVFARHGLSPAPGIDEEMRRVALR